MPLAPKGVHDLLRVEWLVATMRHGDRGTTRPSKTYNDLGRETVTMIEVSMDEKGIITDKLEETLKKLRSEGRLVKLIYTIPTGQNPILAPTK